MTYLLIIVGLVLLLFILKKTNKKQPRVGDVVTTEGVIGDNLLIVENVSAEQVEKAIENIKKYGYSIDFEYKLKDGCLFVNHPNGYEFLRLCYIVNCIHYEFEKNKVRCWCTTNKIDWAEVQTLCCTFIRMMRNMTMSILPQNQEIFTNKNFMETLCASRRIS